MLSRVKKSPQSAGFLYESQKLLFGSFFFFGRRLGIGSSLFSGCFFFFGFLSSSGLFFFGLLGSSCFFSLGIYFCFFFLGGRSRCSSWRRRSCRCGGWGRCGSRSCRFGRRRGGCRGLGGSANHEETRDQGGDKFVHFQFPWRVIVAKIPSLEFGRCVCNGWPVGWVDKCA